MPVLTRPEPVGLQPVLVAFGFAGCRSVTPPAVASGAVERGSVLLSRQFWKSPQAIWRLEQPAWTARRSPNPMLRVVRQPPSARTFQSSCTGPAWFELHVGTHPGTTWSSYETPRGGRVVSSALRRSSAEWCPCFTGGLASDAEYDEGGINPFFGLGYLQSLDDDQDFAGVAFELGLTLKEALHG
jgi:hypothetical protein